MSGSSCGTRVLALFCRRCAGAHCSRAAGRGRAVAAAGVVASSGGQVAGQHLVQQVAGIDGALWAGGGGGAAGPVDNPVGSGRACVRACSALRQSSWSAARASPVGPRCVERSSHPWHVCFCVCCIASGAACEPCPRGSLGGLLPFLGGGGSGRAAAASVHPHGHSLLPPCCEFYRCVLFMLRFSLVFLQCSGRHSCR